MFKVVLNLLSRAKADAERDVLWWCVEERAHVKLVWHNGEVFGASYEISSDDGGYLMDSFEVRSDVVKCAKLRGVNARMFVHNVVKGYLDALYEKEKFLYVMPESNSFLVEQAIEGWIEEKGGKERAVSYASAVYLTTDAQFNKIPYKIERHSSR